MSRRNPFYKHRIAGSTSLKKISFLVSSTKCHLILDQVQCKTIGKVRQGEHMVYEES